MSIPNESNIIFENIQNIVEHYRKIEKLSNKEFAAMLGISEQGFYNKKKKPDTWTLGELLIIEDITRAQIFGATKRQASNLFCYGQKF